MTTRSKACSSGLELARQIVGAQGGKLLGAGGGGFLLLFVEPERRAAVAERLNGLIHVGFDIEHIGSRVVVYEQDLGSIAQRVPRLAQRPEFGRTPRALTRTCARPITSA